MTREDVIRIALEVGFYDGEVDKCQLMLERFAYLVAQQERKECEKIIWNADAWIGSDAKIWIVKSIQEKRGNHD